MKYYIECDYYQTYKHGQHVPGDVFHSVRVPGEDRLVSVLADGLGSGVKANVLASLTTTMAARFVASDMDIIKAAEIIMSTLPICSVRQIGYSTFTIVDIDDDGMTRIIEHENPGFVLIRNGEIQEIEKTDLPLKSVNNRTNKLLFSTFQMEPDDRIIFCSDGVTQAGIGRNNTPLGWGDSAVKDFIKYLVLRKPDISARELSRMVVEEALSIDNRKACDDITCGVIYFRNPRQTLLVSGPPYDKKKDVELAQMVSTFVGRKVIAGGTTANIISRELEREIVVNLEDLKFNDAIPPSAYMEGIDLITEGTITLSEVLQQLKGETEPDSKVKTPASDLTDMLLNSDIIHIVVGTRINEAHQDPNLPQELEIRRNLMKNLSKVLTKKYLKHTKLSFI